MIEIRLSRTISVFVLLALLLPWVVMVYLANRSGRNGVAATEAAVAVRSHHEVLEGPWGVLDVEPIILDYSDCGNERPFLRNAKRGIAVRHDIGFRATEWPDLWLLQQTSLRSPCWYMQCF